MTEKLKLLTVLTSVSLTFSSISFAGTDDSVSDDDNGLRARRSVSFCYSDLSCCSIEDTFELQRVVCVTQEALYGLEKAKESKQEIDEYLEQRTLEILEKGQEVLKNVKTVDDDSSDNNSETSASNDGYESGSDLSLLDPRLIPILNKKLQKTHEKLLSLARELKLID